MMCEPPDAISCVAPDDASQIDSPEVIQEKFRVAVLSHE